MNCTEKLVKEIIMQLGFTKEKTPLKECFFQVCEVLFHVIANCTSEKIKG